MEMFKTIDGNSNGFLSLSECDAGVLNVLKLKEVYQLKPVIIRAFNYAKNRGTQKRDESSDYIEKHEFRFFLLALRQYFEYYEAFKRIDQNFDKKIQLEEFKQAQPIMEKWVGKIEDIEKEFCEIDDQGGEGVILFDEFCDWAI